VEILHNESESYPRNLKEIFDPPGVLFVRGKLKSQDDLAIAIVGTRHATNYGLAQARQLAAGLARTGVTIVSGLARGIDAAAHRGALEAGGRTIAVTGSGVLSVYPPEHEELAGDISSQGAVVSESAPLAKPRKGVFPRRNRVISGLSLGVVVVEAANRSGALITASHAVDQNREVFAIPGRVDNRSSRGCHQLLRDGAKLVESPEDVLEELGPLVAPTTTREGREIRRPGELQLNEQEVQVLTAIQSEPTMIDQVAVESGLPVHRVLSTVSVLEARHLIRRVSGNQVARN
jgi:DNA processing protein